MKIQAGHMNLGFMQELQQRKNQSGNPGGDDALLNDSPGMRLGKGLSLDPAHAGLTPAAEALIKAPGQIDKPEKFEARPVQGEQTLGATFANEIIRRMGETMGEDGQPKDPTDLRHSLGQTMDWMRERFGDETAAAAAGMILQSTSSGVTEETLGDGLLNTVRFIDRNFGFAAGDAVMDKYNSGVNTELNEFFDNGKNETFFAVTSKPGSEPSATQDLNTRFFMRAVQLDQSDEADTENLTEKLLKDLKADLDKTAEMQNLAATLDGQFSPAKVTPQAVVAAYEAAPMSMEPQFTSLAI